MSKLGDTQRRLLREILDQKNATPATIAQVIQSDQDTTDLLVRVARNRQKYEHLTEISPDTALLWLKRAEKNRRKPYYHRGKDTLYEVVSNLESASSELIWYVIYSVLPALPHRGYSHKQKLRELENWLHRASQIQSSELAPNLAYLIRASSSKTSLWEATQANQFNHGLFDLSYDYFRSRGHNVGIEDEARYKQLHRGRVSRWVLFAFGVVGLVAILLGIGAMLLNYGFPDLSVGPVATTPYATAFPTLIAPSLTEPPTELPVIPPTATATSVVSSNTVSIHFIEWQDFLHANAPLGKIVFSRPDNDSNRDGVIDNLDATNLYLLRLPDANILPLTLGANNNHYPVWSQDGAVIAVLSSNPDGGLAAPHILEANRFDIARPIDPSTRLVSPGNYAWLKWYHDGSALLALCDDHRICSISRSGRITVHCLVDGASFEDSQRQDSMNCPKELEYDLRPDTFDLSVDETLFFVSSTSSIHSPSTSVAALYKSIINHTHEIIVAERQFSLQELGLEDNSIIKDLAISSQDQEFPIALLVKQADGSSLVILTNQDGTRSKIIEFGDEHLSIQSIAWSSDPRLLLIAAKKIGMGEGGFYMINIASQEASLIPNTNQHDADIDWHQ